MFAHLVRKVSAKREITKKLKSEKRSKRKVPNQIAESNDKTH